MVTFEKSRKSPLPSDHMWTFENIFEHPRTSQQILNTSIRCAQDLFLKGKGGVTKLDDFLGKFQMASDPPPPLIFGKLYRKFFMIDMVAYMRGGTQKCLLQSVSCFYFSQYNCWKNICWTLKFLFCINFMIKKPSFFKTLLRMSIEYLWAIESIQRTSENSENIWKHV